MVTKSIYSLLKTTKFSKIRLCGLWQDKLLWILNPIEYCEKRISMMYAIWFSLVSSFLRRFDTVYVIQRRKGCVFCLRNNADIVACLNVKWTNIGVHVNSVSLLVASYDCKCRSYPAAYDDKGDKWGMPILTLETTHAHFISLHLIYQSVLV